MENKFIPPLKGVGFLCFPYPSFDKITFDIGSPSMEDLTTDDIKFRLKEYLDMNIPPFGVNDMKFQ